MILVRDVLAFAAASALACAPAAAQQCDWAPGPEAVAARLSAVGTWDFSSTKHNQSGRPVCREIWTFNADGTGQIVSGKQRTTMRWSIIRYAGIGQYLFFDQQHATSDPDCLGNVADPAKDGEGSIGMELLFFADGEGALICFGGNDGRRDDDSRYPSLDPELCWGQIVPATKPTV